LSEDTTTVDPLEPVRAGVRDTVQEEETGTGHGHRHLGIALAVITMAQLMVVLDATIVNIALPSLKIDLGFSNANLPWVVNAYALTFGGLLLLGGRIGDILGRRKVFMFGVVLFGVASFMGGIAQSEDLLLFSRVLQGVGAAAASPNALALITTTFPAGKERNRAMAVYAAMSGAGAAVGLIIGGALTEASWRWTFFINTPIGIAVAVAAVVFLGESARQKGRFDLPGAITGTVGLTALVYGLTHAANPGPANGPEGGNLWDQITGSGGWDSPWTWTFIIGGLLLVGIFLVIEATSKHALMPFRILANRTRAVSFGVMLMIAASLFAMFYFLGIYIQSILGYSPLKTGFAFLPFSLGIILTAGFVSYLLPRVGPRVLILPGLAMAVVGMLLLTQIDQESSYWVLVFPAMVIMSVGLAGVFIPAASTSLVGVQSHDAGVASAVLNTSQQIGGSLGTALLNTLFAGAVTAYFTDNPPASPDEADQILPLAFIHGYHVAFFGGAVLFAVALIVSFVFITAHKEDIPADPAAVTDPAQ
jgi:MFS family permease